MKLEVLHNLWNRKKFSKYTIRGVHTPVLEVCTTMEMLLHVINILEISFKFVIIYILLMNKFEKRHTVYL